MCRLIFSVLFSLLTPTSVNVEECDIIDPSMSEVNIRISADDEQEKEQQQIQQIIIDNVDDIININNITK